MSVCVCVCVCVCVIDVCLVWYVCAYMGNFWVVMAMPERLHFCVCVYFVYISNMCVCDVCLVWYEIMGDT